MTSKRLRIQVNGHAAVAWVRFSSCGLICSVEVTTELGKARSTCKPNMWRILAASLVTKMYRQHPDKPKLPKNWMQL